MSAPVVPGVSLVVDGGSQVLCVSVVVQGRVTAEERSPAQQAHGVAVLDMVASVLARSGLTADKLDALVVGAGPGSFTGLRTVMATVKGLALGWGKPLWGVPTLHALSRSVDVAVGTVVVAALDARKGEVYAGAWRRGETVLQDQVVLEPCAINAVVLAERALAWSAPHLSGDAGGKFPEALGVLAARQPGWPHAFPPAEALVACVAVTPPVDLEALEPIYIRKSYVELALGAPVSAGRAP